METNWVYGDGEDHVFWLEYDSPSCKVWVYYFDMDDVPEQTRFLLRILDKLGIIEFGLFFETAEMIRIRNAGLGRIL